MKRSILVKIALLFMISPLTLVIAQVETPDVDLKNQVNDPDSNLLFIGVEAINTNHVIEGQNEFGKSKTAGVDVTTGIEVDQSKNKKSEVTEKKYLLLGLKIKSDSRIALEDPTKAYDPTFNPEFSQDNLEIGGGVGYGQANNLDNGTLYQGLRCDVSYGQVSVDTDNYLAYADRGVNVGLTYEGIFEKKTNKVRKTHVFGQSYLKVSYNHGANYNFQDFVTQFLTYPVQVPAVKGAVGPSFKLRLVKTDGLQSASASTAVNFSLYHNVVTISAGAEFFKVNGIDAYANNFAYECVRPTVGFRFNLAVLNSFLSEIRL